jgi:hypothetical protein
MAFCNHVAQGLLPRPWADRATDLGHRLIVPLCAGFMATPLYAHCLSRRQQQDKDKDKEAREFVLLPSSRLVRMHNVTSVQHPRATPPPGAEDYIQLLY